MKKTHPNLLKFIKKDFRTSLKMPFKCLYKFLISSSTIKNAVLQLGIYSLETLNITYNFPLIKCEKAC